MTTKNPIPSEAEGGKLEITFPDKAGNASFLTIQPSPTTTCKIDGS